MRREINSPAIRVQIPDDPFMHIDFSCSAFDGSLIDKTGNTYSCSESIEFWTNGFSSGTVSLGRSPINSINFSMNFWMLSTGNALKYPLIMGNRSENGIWLECQGNSLRFKSNAGTLFSGIFEKSFTFGLTRSSTTLRFFLNGVFQQETMLNASTENSGEINIMSDDRMNHFLMYGKTLTDSAMSDLYSLTFQSSKGFDHLGYLNSIQSFSMET